MIKTFRFCLLAALLSMTVAPAFAQAQPRGTAVGETAQRHAGGEASLILPDLGQAEFAGMNARSLLMAGLLVCVLGLAFGMAIYRQLKNLPVHQSMREISELIYETCKTYLITQGKFILLLDKLMMLNLCDLVLIT